MKQLTQQVAVLMNRVLKQSIYIFSPENTHCTLTDFFLRNQISFSIRTDINNACNWCEYLQVFSYFLTDQLNS